MSKLHREDILLISPSVIGVDPRVNAHLEVLCEFGSVVTAGYGPQPPSVVDHIRVPDGFSYLPKNIVGLFRLLSRNFNSAALATPFSTHLFRALNDRRFRIVVANDVHSLAVATKFARESGAKLWVDMHEYAPREGDSDWRWRLFLQKYVTHLCGTILPDADVLTTVGEKIAEQYQDDSGRSCVVLRNTVPYLANTGFGKAYSADRPVRLVHVGVSIKARRLENMIQAVSGYDKVTLDLYLLPTDRRYHQKLLSMSRDLDNVRLNEPVDPEEIITTLAQYDCGVVTIPPTSFNYEHALPNKFFQYIQARLPVITGPSPEMSSIVKQYGIGWVTDNFSADSIRDTLGVVCSADLASMERPLEKAAKRLARENEQESRREICRRLLGKN